MGEVEAHLNSEGMVDPNFSNGLPVFVNPGREALVFTPPGIPEQRPKACVPHALGVVRKFYEPHFVWDDRLLDLAVGFRGQEVSGLDLSLALLKAGRYALTGYALELESDYEGSLFEEELDEYSDLIDAGILNEWDLLSSEHVEPDDENDREVDEKIDRLFAYGLKEVRLIPDFDLIYDNLARGRLVMAAMGGRHMAIIHRIRRDHADGDPDEFTLSAVKSSKIDSLYDASSLGVDIPESRVVTVVDAIL